MTARRRVAWLAGLLLVLSAATLGARDLYLHGKARLAGFLVRRAWVETLRTGRHTPPWPWADSYPIGRLVIPRLGVDEVVLEASSPRILAFGPARLMSGAAPGEPGNVVLAGHRTSTFRPLEGARAGDELFLEWRDPAGAHRRRYRVASVRVVDPSEVSHLAPTADDALTLVTCYPFGPTPGSPLRFVVRAWAEGA